MRKARTLVVAMGLFACGGGGTGNPGDDGTGVDASVPDTSQPGDWAQLVGRDWTVPPGSADTYKCTRIRIEQEMWVAGFRAIAPVGTHHTVVTISNTSTPLGDYDCDVNNLDFQMLYASGVGTEELSFPAGVGMKLEAGQYIHLNLHLYNASDAPLTGFSGIEIKPIAAADVVHEADMVFAGSMDINIPSDGQPHTVSGGCNAPRDWNVFTLWPHMHQFATHQKLELTENGQPVVLLDSAYDFEEQRNYTMATRLIKAGTPIRTTCTFVNNSGVSVTFGDSSNQEMCFTGMYKYPAGGHLFQCAL